MKKGINIIIGGDFNESLYSPEKMSTMMETAGLYNVFQHCMNTDTLPRTHARGSKAVDHIWVSKYVLDNIIHAGIAPFGHTYESDHRGMYIDIDESILFHHDDVRMVFHDFRRLKSKTPKRVKKYMKYVEREWKSKKIVLQYLELVEFCMASDDKVEISTRLNKIDETITDILTKAEKKCTRLSNHHLDTWTPELLASLKRKRHCRTKLTQAQKLPNKIGLVGSLDRYKEAHENYVQAKREYNEIWKTIKSARAEFLQERAVYAALLKDTVAEKEIKSIIEIERQRDQANRIQNVLKRRHGGGPNSILIPAKTEYENFRDPDFDHFNINTIWDRIEQNNGEDISNWDRVTDQALVEQMLLQWEQKHFGQANEIPLASPHWRDQIKDRAVQQLLLNVKYPIPTDLPQEAQDLLLEMRRPPEDVHEIKPVTTLDDFKHYIKTIDEKRSSSPSGRHYGHYKTLLDYDETYLKIIHGILEIALRLGVILDRWRTTVTALMEKKSGTPYIHKFRVIHVVEGDLQFLSKKFTPIK